MPARVLVFDHNDRLPEDQLSWTPLTKYLPDTTICPVDMFAFRSNIGQENAMSDGSEITRLQKRVEQLSAENAALREEGFRGSKADALMALGYDRIPNVLKTPRAIRIQRKVATAVMIIVLVLLVAIAIGGGVSAYRDQQRSVELKALDAKLESDFRQAPPNR